MINSLNSNMSAQSMQMPSRQNDMSLSDDQQTFITKALSEFNPDELTQSDAQSIVEAFSQAGIQPGKALESAMSDLGFDAKTVGDLAGVSEQGKGNRPPPPPKQSTDEISSIVDYLSTLMEEKYSASNSNTLTDDDKQSIMQQVIDKFGLEDGDSLINTSA